MSLQNQQIHLALGRIEIDSRVHSNRHEQVRVPLDQFIFYQVIFKQVVLEFQLEFLKWDVSQSSVKLTAAGLFDITPRLFPKV